MNTYAYYVYYGRDRDDWQKDQIQANSIEDAVRKAQDEWLGTGYTVKNSSFQIIDNQ